MIHTASTPPPFLHFLDLFFSSERTTAATAKTRQPSAATAIALPGGNEPLKPSACCSSKDPLGTLYARVILFLKKRGGFKT
jgi:hypothetical protein